VCCATILVSVRVLFQVCASLTSVVGNAEKSADIHVIVKIESADSIPNLQSILDAADGVGLCQPGSLVCTGL
jgi:hypothetical protein